MSSLLSKGPTLAYYQDVAEGIECGGGQVAATLSCRGCACVLGGASGSGGVFLGVFWKRVEGA